MKNMNQDLKDNPKWAALYLQDMMDIIQHWADEDSLRQVVCYAKAYLRDMTEEEDDNKLTDDKKQFLILRNPVMRTFMNFVKFCYDVGCSCEECRVEKEEKCSVLNKDEEKREGKEWDFCYTILILFFRFSQC